MGTAQVKTKSKQTKSLIQPPKVLITIQFNPQKQIPLQLSQLTNWSLSEIKLAYQTIQRITQSPMLDSFLFKKMMPLSRKNCDMLFKILAQGDKFISMFQIMGILVLTSYQTYRKKFQFLCLIFDLQHKGFVNGKQLQLIFYSVMYGYCRLTQHKLPKFQIVQRFSQASLFPGQDNYQNNPMTLRKFIQEYDGNTNISQIFNRFQKFQFKQIKEDPLIFSISEFMKYTHDDIQKFYRILYKTYAKGDYQEVYLIQHNKQLRRQNRRDSCYRNLIQLKNSLHYDSPMITKRSQTLSKIHAYTPQTEKLTNTPIKNSTQKSQQFRIKRMNSTVKIKLKQKNKLIFLNGNTYSKNQIFQTIHYFKIFAQSEDKISIKSFFKRFQTQVHMKKQLSSIFKYLDHQGKGQISLKSFFKSFYHGISEQDLKLLMKWYAEYQQIYEADSLTINQAKVSVMNDSRILPVDTIQRMRQIFKAIDIGGKGYLIFEDLRKAYRHGFTVNQLQKLLKQYGDGQKIYLNGLCKILLPYGWSIQHVDLDKLI